MRLSLTFLMPRASRAISGLVINILIGADTGVIAVTITYRYKPVLFCTLPLLLLSSAREVRMRW